MTAGAQPRQSPLTTVLPGAISPPGLQVAKALRKARRLPHLPSESSFIHVNRLREPFKECIPRGVSLTPRRKNSGGRGLQIRLDLNTDSTIKSECSEFFQSYNFQVFLKRKAGFKLSYELEHHG